MPAGLLSDPLVRRVAVVRLRVGLGDVLCTVPALRALRRARPDVHVALVTWAEMAPLVDRFAAYVDELLPFPGAPGIPDRPPEPDGWAAFTAAAAERCFDLALQAYGDNPAANTVSAALGATRVGGFAPTGWAPLHDPDLHLAYPTTVHEVDRHLRLVEHLGLGRSPGDAVLEFPLTAAEEVAHEDRLTRLRLEPAAYAVLHPGASSPSRRWPAVRFAAVGDALAARGLRVVLTGVAGERALTTRVAAAMSTPAVDLAGRTDLPALAALLRDAAVVVANDTGTAHLAAAVGAPSVVAFLPGDPRRWAHPGPRHRAAHIAVGCNPCPHLHCPIDHRCATALTPARMLAEVDAALAADPRP